MRFFAFLCRLCKSGAKLRNFVITATFTDYIFAIFAQNPVFLPANILPWKTQPEVKLFYQLSFEMKFYNFRFEMQN